MHRYQMPVIPPDVHVAGGARFTGITCPACPGALMVIPEDRGRLSFECRIGHLYSTPELVTLKEKRTEDLLWAAVEALEELSAFLRDACVDGERAQRADDEARALRSLIERTVPARIDLPPSAGPGEEQP
jgi:hypothetical protein